MRQHSIASGQGSWSNSNIIGDYKEDVAYDANGNILKYLRNGTTAGSNPLGMDSLTYYYNNKTNQLNVIHDSVPAANYINDLDNQSANNYAYDSVGNGIQDNSAGTSNIKWTVYGKIKQGSGLAGYTEYFRYDPNNNRIAREMQYNGLDNTLYYIRDASGNTIATYNYDGSNLSWVEQDLYGSSRVGIWNWKQALPSRTMVPQSETDTLNDWYMLGTRSYELTNHLGNVLGVISDKKIGVSSGGTVVDYYNAEVLSQQDYYPFGMQEPVRGYNAGSYAYGFNGKRMEPLDPYITDLYDYGERMYYAKVGRFFTVDPLTQKYPDLTPYQFASNTPVQAIDLDGLEKFSINFNGKAYSIFGPYTRSEAPRRLLKLVPQQEKEDYARTIVETYKIASEIHGNKNAYVVLEYYHFIFKTTFDVSNIGLTALSFGSYGLFDRGAIREGEIINSRLLNEIPRDPQINQTAEQLPTRLARVIPEDNAGSPTLGKQGNEDVFVTTPEELRGLNSEGIAKRLALKDSKGNYVKGPFRIIEFDTPSEGLAQPLNRNNIGFVNGGKTSGGAAEYVIPNMKLSELKNVIQKTVR